MSESDNLSIDFDFSYYLPIIENDENNQILPNKIIELDSEQIKCQRIVVSAIGYNLEPGRRYQISYSLTNSNNEIFTPSSEIFYASKKTQKFSTIASVNAAEIYIMKVLIQKMDSVVAASDMITVKCGIITSCPVESIPIILSEYVRFDNKPVLNVVAPYRCDSQVNLNAQIYNAKLGSEYSYVFSSINSSSTDIISFIPNSGNIIAGDSIQNINSIAKFIGKSGLYSVKITLTNENNQEFEDYLIVQCFTCS
jgi:hypothetical protein